MPIDITQLRVYVIQPTLNSLGLYSSAAENLLLGTMAVESALGTYVHQIGGGPALGVYQMEPDTHDDIWENYIKFNDWLRVRLWTIGSYSPVRSNNGMLLITDLRYATIMARLQYYRHSEPLPNANDVDAQSVYWKKYWNTVQGAGTHGGYVRAANFYGVYAE